MTPIFQIVFGQQFVGNIQQQQREEDMQHAVRESALDSFSLPPWTTTGRGVRRTVAPKPTQKRCTW